MAMAIATFFLAAENVPAFFPPLRLPPASRVDSMFTAIRPPESTAERHGSAARIAVHSEPSFGGHPTKDMHPNNDDLTTRLRKKLATERRRRLSTSLQLAGKQQTIIKALQAALPIPAAVLPLKGAFVVSGQCLRAARRSCAVSHGRRLSVGGHEAHRAKQPILAYRGPRGWVAERYAREVGARGGREVTARRPIGGCTYANGSSPARLKISWAPLFSARGRRREAEGGGRAARFPLS